MVPISIAFKLVLGYDTIRYDVLGLARAGIRTVTATVPNVGREKGVLTHQYTMQCNEQLFALMILEVA